MRLVLIHGINQQGIGADALRDQWTADLTTGLGADLDLGGIELDMPFFGDDLARMTAADTRGAVAQGAGAPSDLDEATFLATGLEEQAKAAGFRPQEIAREERNRPVGAVVEQGFPMGLRINAVARLLERASPLHGDLALRLLKQAYAYLRRPDVTAAIDAVVRPTMVRGPAVVVSHSLGTAVAFKLLRELALQGEAARIPLFVTLGSPLALRTVRSALGPAFAIPQGVGRWLNAVDPRDFVALGQSLDERTFSAGIDNIPDVTNIPGDAHAIEGYLRDGRVAEAVVAALRAA